MSFFINIKSWRAPEYFTLATSLLVLFIPIWPNILPILIISTAVSGFFIPAYAQKIKNALQYRSVWLPALLYILYLIGLIYSEDLHYGLKDLETKLSLLVMPIILIPVISLSEDKKRIILKSFVIGCSIAIVLLTFYATYLYINEQIRISKGWYVDNYGINFFLSARWSVLIHPSYTAMYFNLALMLIWKFDFFKPLWRTILIGLFALAIILTASKAGLIFLFIQVFIIAGYYIVKRKKYLAGFIMVFILSGGFFTMYLRAPEFANKINNAVNIFSANTTDKTTTESSGVRLLVWQTAFDLIAQKPVTGFGTGDVKNEMLNSYRQNGYSGALEKKLNAHNQFLQTGVALGIVGMVLLFLCFIIPILATKNMIITFFLSLLFFNSLFESVLETQAGTVFFGFFYAFLIFAAYQAQPIEQSKTHLDIY